MNVSTVFSWEKYPGDERCWFPRYVGYATKVVLFNGKEMPVALCEGFCKVQFPDYMGRKLYANAQFGAPEGIAFTVEEVARPIYRGATLWMNFLFGFKEIGKLDYTRYNLVKIGNVWVPPSKPDVVAEARRFKTIKDDLSVKKKEDHHLIQTCVCVTAIALIGFSAWMWGVSRTEGGLPVR